MKPWGNLKCVLISERSQSEKATSCMIPNIWHSGAETMETVKRSMVIKGWEGRWRERQEIFRAVWYYMYDTIWYYILYDTIMVETWHCMHLAKPLEFYDIKSELWMLGNNNLLILVHQLFVQCWKKLNNVYCPVGSSTNIPHQWKCLL